MNIKRIEEIEPIFQVPEVAKIGGQPRLYRFRHTGASNRFYFREGFDEYYLSITSWIKECLGTPYGLAKWMMQVGEVTAKQISFEAREYGSMFHTMVAMHENHQEGFSYTFGSLAMEGFILDYMRDNRLPLDKLDEWVLKIENDFLAYFQWKKDENVKVLAIEYPVWNDAWGVGSLIDLVVEKDVEVYGDFGVTYKRSAKKDAEGNRAYEAGDVRITKGVSRQVAIIDLKSGDKSAAYKEYKMQGKTYLGMWNERFAGTAYEAETFYNWHPKDRSRSPGKYNLNNNVGGFSDKSLDLYGQICKEEGWNVPKKDIRTVEGGEEDFTVYVQTPQDYLKSFFQNSEQ